VTKKITLAVLYLAVSRAATLCWKPATRRYAARNAKPTPNVLLFPEEFALAANASIPPPPLPSFVLRRRIWSAHYSALPNGEETGQQVYLWVIIVFGAVRPGNHLLRQAVQMVH